MIHTATGWWLDEAGAVTPFAPLAGDERADVVVVGGGYAGLWAAWQLHGRGANVTVLEAGVCGHGPSGRNGGFCESLWGRFGALEAALGRERAVAVARASQESVDAIGAWCEAEGVDAWFAQRGSVVVSTAPAHDAALPAPPAPAAVALSPAEVAERCASPAFRGGVLFPGDATVQPARLALGLRARVAARGARVFEHSPVRALHAGPDGVVARTPGGSVHAGHAVLAVNAAARAIGPLRHRLAVASSHIVLTEPVPDVLEAVGWTGGEALSDARTFLHYFRTTRDRRIAFGWGGGPIACGARLGGRIELDGRTTAAAAAELVRLFPALRGRALTHAWGGPIDVSPTHLPQVGALGDGRVLYALGFTGNGVGPSHLAGRALAQRIVGEEPVLPLVAPGLRVPGEPLAWAGGALVRAAQLRREAFEARGARPSPLVRAVTAAPARLGLHLGRS